MSDIPKTYTVNDFIYEGSISTVLSHDKLCMKEKISDGVYIPSYDVLNDYIPELLEIAKDCYMSDTDFAKYQFKPRLLSYYLYGSEELYFIIMIINQICTPKEFNFKQLKLFMVEDLVQALSYIYSSEEENITNNRNKIGLI